MRFVTFYRADGRLAPGVLQDGAAVDLQAADPSFPDSVQGIFARRLTDRARAIADDARAARVENARLAAPIPCPGKILCIGLNYRDHAIESGAAIPAEPIVFSKFPASIVGPGSDIVLPACSQEVDFEVELVVVVGQRASRVARSEALSYVGGYTIGNDVSARDWQLKKPGGQWLLGKSFPTFAPLGPAIVTPDELDDPANLAIALQLNGRPMQASTTAQLIFPVDELIAYLSQIMPLEPGDLIFTGTPPGVGFARKPPVYLQPGDVCEATIAGLGALTNACVGPRDA